MMIADIKQSALAHRNVKLVPELPSGATVRTLDTIHNIDPLKNIERELREIEKTVAGLKEEAKRPGEARKCAQAMLRQLTTTRADLIAIRRSGAASSETNCNERQIDPAGADQLPSLLP
jgi:hypothetical protein